MPATFSCIPNNEVHVPLRKTETSIFIAIITTYQKLFGVFTVIFSPGSAFILLYAQQLPISTLISALVHRKQVPKYTRTVPYDLATTFILE